MTLSFLLFRSIRYEINNSSFFHSDRNKQPRSHWGWIGAREKSTVQYICFFFGWRSAVGTTICWTVAERRSLLQMCTTNSVADFRHIMYSECTASAWERVAGRHCGAETARTKGKLLAWAGNKLVAGRPRTHHLANIGDPVIIIGPADKSRVAYGRWMIRGIYQILGLGYYDKP